MKQQVSTVHYTKMVTQAKLMNSFDSVTTYLHTYTQTYGHLLIVTHSDTVTKSHTKYKCEKTPKPRQVKLNFIRIEPCIKVSANDTDVFCIYHDTTKCWRNTGIWFDFDCFQCNLYWLNQPYCGRHLLNTLCKVYLLNMDNFFLFLQMYYVNCQTYSSFIIYWSINWCFFSLKICTEN